MRNSRMFIVASDGISPGLAPFGCIHHINVSSDSFSLDGEKKKGEKKKQKKKNTHLELK
uniref:Uncharacterized protein n=1 Tax=Rhizophora mucronata TaxID=61149 RepID=A0A2P2P4D6_RHIMU